MRATQELPDSDEARSKLTQPLSGVLYFFAVFIGGIGLIGLGSLAFGANNMSIFGIGRGSACVDAYLNGIATQGTGLVITGLRPGASNGTGGTLPLCVMHPTAGQRALEILTAAPSPLFYLAIMLLALQLLTVIRRQGPFAMPVVRRLRFLAWFLLIGSVAVTVGQHIGAAYFLASAVSQPVPVASDVLTGSSIVVIPLFVACGLLTLARILRVGARMQDDLAGTV